MCFPFMVYPVFNIRTPLSRREVTLLVPLTHQQHELYKMLLCSLDSSTLEVGHENLLYTFILCKPTCPHKHI
jgi:hypothetical protein